MPNITEPKMLLTATEVCELVATWKVYAEMQADELGYTPAEKEEIVNRYNWHQNKAYKAIVKMNKLIWSN